MARAGEELTATFSAEEQQLIDQLRTKYTSTGAPAAAQAQAPAQPPPAATAATQPAGCRLCVTCQGTGSVVEAYNHRTLERCCPECRGQGIASSGGGSDGSSTLGSSTRSGSNYRSTHSSGGSGGKSAHERLAGWEAELEAVKQSLAGVADAQELQLKSALILELERAAAVLRKNIAATKQEEQVPPPTQGLAKLSLGSSAGEEVQGHSHSAAMGTGQEGHTECCAAAAHPSAEGTSEAGAAATSES